VACDGLRTVLYDGRAASATFTRSVDLRSAAAAPYALLIPPGVWHATQNVDHVDREIVNLPTAPFDHSDPDKWTLDAHAGPIEVDWA
jgi:dTDP-4-dehydrorhamnose 3,5-epimerase-like enzyme